MSSITNIETGKTDPRMSTGTRLVVCFGASLKDLESTPPAVIGMDELKQRSERASKDPDELIMGSVVMLVSLDVDEVPA
ncbi:MAG TPA: hypothetical protein VF115_08015 [Acidimicrobiia bacterium]